MEYPTDKDYETAEQNGISKRNVYQRVFDYGYDVKRAITEPLRTYSEEWTKWKETAKEIGISNSLYNARLRKGMTPEKAATTPKGVIKQPKGLYAIYKEQAEALGISESTFYRRMRPPQSMTPEQAATTPLMPLFGNGVL